MKILVLLFGFPFTISTKYDYFHLYPTQKVGDESSATQCLSVSIGTLYTVAGDKHKICSNFFLDYSNNLRISFGGAHFDGHAAIWDTYGLKIGTNKDSTYSFALDIYGDLIDFAHQSQKYFLCGIQIFPFNGAMANNFNGALANKCITVFLATRNI